MVDNGVTRLVLKSTNYYAAKNRVLYTTTEALGYVYTAFPSDAVVSPTILPCPCEGFLFGHGCLLLFVKNNSTLFVPFSIEMRCRVCQ